MKFEHTEVMNFEGAFRGMRNPLDSWHKSDSIFYMDCEHEHNEDAAEVAHAWAEKLTEDLEKDNDDYIEAYDQAFKEKLDWLCENGLRYMKEDHHYTGIYIGPNDMDLARRLIAGGTEHRKFLRQIFVSVDITAPLYWWKEFDTYKVGTTANSTSTMHKLASTPITRECFEMTDFKDVIIEGVESENEELSFVYTTGMFVEEIIETLEELRQKYNETKDKRYWKELVRWLPNGWLQTRTVTMNYENLRSMYHQRKHHKLTEWSEAFCEWVESLPYAKELIVE